MLSSSDKDISTSPNQGTVKTPNYFAESYPILCFCLAGILGLGAIANSGNLDDSRWTAILGLSGAALTAGAGIAQAPRKE